MILLLLPFPRYWPGPAIEVCLICTEVRVIGEAREDRQTQNAMLLAASTSARPGEIMRLQLGRIHRRKTI
jgi:hypothetical protein